GALPAGVAGGRPPALASSAWLLAAPGMALAGAVAGQAGLLARDGSAALKIHEYQAKEILRKYGVTTLPGGLATTPEEAAEVAKELATPVVVVKAQIHAGGRGKGGGIRLARSPEEAAEYARRMLGAPLVT